MKAWVMICFGGCVPAMMGFKQGRRAKSNGEIDACPDCGKMAQWLEIGWMAEGVLVVWKERLS